MVLLGAAERREGELSRWLRGRGAFSSSRCFGVFLRVVEWREGELSRWLRGRGAFSSSERLVFFLGADRVGSRLSEEGTGISTEFTFGIR